VTVEAESLPYTSPWKVVEDSAASGGKYLVWEGMKAEENNGSAEDGNAISTTINIPAGGTYSFKVTFCIYQNGHDIRRRRNISFRLVRFGHLKLIEFVLLTYQF